MTLLHFWAGLGIVCTVLSVWHAARDSDFHGVEVALGLLLLSLMGASVGYGLAHTAIL